MALLGSPTSRNHITSALEANLRKAYLERYKIVGKTAIYPRIYDVMGSDIYLERLAVYAGLGTYDTLVEGAVPDYDSGQEAWNKAFQHNQYAKGVEITRIAIKDDLHGVIASFRRRGGGLAEAARYTRERDAMDLFNSTWVSGTAYTAGGSNYSALSTTHFRVDGGTWSNKFAASTDLSYEALELAIQHWMVNQKNQRGQIQLGMPSTLLVAPGNAMLARRILNSVKMPQSADNDTNEVRDIISEVIEHPLLTNDGRWALMAPKAERRMPYFDREAPNIEQWPDGENGSLRFVGFYRESHGLVDPSGLFGTD
jgi:hypothetical protein